METDHRLDTLETTQPKLRNKPRGKSELEIVPASRRDMSLVADFVSSSADWYRPIVDEKDMAEHDVGEAWAEKNFELRDFYIGITPEGEKIGTISVQYFGDFAYLGYIYLDVNQVGKGYGQQLMNYAESVVRRAGKKGMILIAHPEATWAKRAYLKYGFEIIASDKNDVLAWQEGALGPYYEEGFELYCFEFQRIDRAREAVKRREPNA